VSDDDTRAGKQLKAALQRRGYATAAFSAYPHLDPAFGLARGFSRVESRLVDGALLERRKAADHENIICSCCRHADPGKFARIDAARYTAYFFAIHAGAGQNIPDRL